MTTTSWNPVLPMVGMRMLLGVLARTLPHTLNGCSLGFGWGYFFFLPTPFPTLLSHTNRRGLEDGTDNPASLQPFVLSIWLLPDVESPRVTGYELAGANQALLSAWGCKTILIHEQVCVCLT